MRAMREALSSTRRRSAWGRTASLGLVAALTFLLSGDRGRAASDGGIDPLEILNLQVRPNAIVVLDSSGSMRQRPTGTSNTTVSSGGTVGDDAASKMYQAKEVIRKVVTDNQTRVSFMFGQYTQSTSSFGPETSPTFLYKVNCTAADTTCQSDANAISIPWGTAGLRRSQTNDLYTEADGSKTYYLESNTFYNGVLVNVRSSDGNCGSPCTTTTGAPAKTDPAPVKVQRRRDNGNATGTAVTFHFQGVRWDVTNDNSTSCGGFSTKVALQSCTNNDQIALLNPYLRKEVVRNTSGDLVNPDGTVWNGTNSTLPSVSGGIRSSGYTPIATSIDDIKGVFDGTIWPNRPNTEQRTFLIFVTDGDDTCGGYRQAAYSAQQLYNASATDPTQKVQTFVIVFGSSASTNQANQIAYGGSGLTDVPDADSDEEWDRDATADEVADCTTCQKAFTAADADALGKAIQAAIDMGANSGEFSDQQSITESIFELGGVVPTPVDPLDPTERYNATIPVLLQSTFEMPDFAGHLKAFRNVAGGATLLWDAGDMLCRRVTGYKASSAAVPAVCDVSNAASLVDSTAMGPGTFTFDQLTGGSTLRNIGGSSARIRRRIFTTSQNGVNPNHTPPNLVGATDATSPATWGAQVPLWPPTTCSDSTCVDPDKQGSAFAAGALDDELGIAGLTATQLATQFGACQVTSGGTLHGECTTNGFPAKEARRIILAFTAGAEVALGPDGLPRRETASPYGLLFRARPWILAESTLAAPGISGPPLQNRTSIYSSEYTLYRDGPRASGTAKNGLDAGFGLRNPDDDGQSTSQADAALKPVMSVVYHGTNHMLHAFRAGPSCTTTAVASGVTVPTCTENGGEELWAFVPHDQLGKLRSRMTGQSRTDPVYVIAAPVRFADIFVRGDFSKAIGGVTTSGAGVWRTVLLVGRGAGGKSLTAIDVTMPGPFTRLADQAWRSSWLPVVVWNRGNPDTSDGKPKGGSNTYNNTTGAGSSDYNAYLKMGETWSVPAVGRVTAADNVTTRKPGGIDFAAWAGSGYSDVPGEGRTFYALDPLTGDILGLSSQAAHTLADGTSSAGVTNAIVASPAAFAARPLSFFNLSSPQIFSPVTETVTAVYFPDLHGRVFRFRPSSPATAPTLFKDLSGDGDQPVANAVALLNFDSDGSTISKPHVFLEAGNDTRVPAPAASPFFRMYALRDDGTAGADVFSPIDFPAGYRGTVQPATVFNAQGYARVFYAGTRFNPPQSDCVSSFDSVIFALQGATGDAAYNLSTSASDLSVTLEDQRVSAVRTSGGQLVVDLGLGAQNPPPPPAPPVTTTSTSGTHSNVRMGSTVPGTIPFKVGSAVCR